MHLHQFLVSREYGGGAEVALQLARRTHATIGSCTRVWVPGEGRAAERVRASGLPLTWYSGEAIFSRFRTRVAAANLWTGVRLRSMGRGLVHVHSPFTYAALRHGLRLSGLKRVLHIHLDFELDGLRWALKSPPDLIVTCARFLIDGVREALPSAVRNRVPIVGVPNAVDLERFAPGDKAATRQRLGAPADRPLLLMMANLAPHKGQLTAIRAVAKLRQRGVLVELWLAGADRAAGQPFAAELRRVVAELALDAQVKLLGFRQDGPELLQAADMVLLPSTSEGLPLTLLEAQASGVPVLAAPTAGIPEIVQHEQTGMLIAADDAAGYAAAVERLLNNPELRRDITVRATEQCRARHSWDAYHRTIADLYAEVLAS